MLAKIIESRSGRGTSKSIMKDGFIKPLTTTRPTAPVPSQSQRSSASSQPQQEIDAEAAVPNLKPEIENPKQALEALTAITQKLSSAGGRGLDAVGAIDADRINKLLSDD